MNIRLVVRIMIFIIRPTDAANNRESHNKNGSCDVVLFVDAKMTAANKRLYYGAQSVHANHK